jgi:hypothetical protein
MYLGLDLIERLPASPDQINLHLNGGHAPH